MRNPKFIGVYSRNSQGYGKGGVLARRALFFVWDIGEGSYVAQELNKAFIPQGGPRLISLAQLKTGFQLEPNVLAAPMSMPDLSGLGVGKKPGARPEEDISASDLRELESARRSRQVENDMRGNFDKAVRALSRPRDRKGALVALEHLANATEGVVPAHKHMFRDFGVTLRKKSLPELALQCAKRVLELSPNDDHAHFNMARVLSILGLYDQADSHLKEAVRLDKSEPIYRRMQEYILSQQGKGRRG